jgi:ABC-type nickel/cobalt efflux system permease component RcnA
MPDPKSYNAHFGDMDANGDDLVNWEEFAAHFQNADQNVFDAINLNHDGNIDHDEWHEFKAAHGLKHKE